MIKLNETKENISCSMESWIIDVMDHCCKILDINRSQIITRAVKYYCVDKLIKSHPELWRSVYGKVVQDSNEDN